MDQALEFLDPSAGQESEDSYPASIHGSPCGFPNPFFPPDGGDRDGARCRPGPAAGPAVPLSAITALPSIGGILQELPEIIEKAAAWRGLLVPPAQESSLAGGRSVSPRYRPSGVNRSGRASRPSGSARRERRRRPLGVPCFPPPGTWLSSAKLPGVCSGEQHRSAVSLHSETIRAALHTLRGFGGDKGKCCWMLQSARMGYLLINCRACGIPLSQIYLLHTVIISPRAPI